MRWIEANGASLRYEMAGSGKDVIVLIHEAGGTLESWDSVTPLLRPGHAVLRYDQRGFGMSERAAGLTLDGMVADLMSLLDELAIMAPCHLVGTAIGGSIALAAAARHPGRVASVVASSPLTGGLPASVRQSLLQRAAVVEREGMRAVAEASLLRSYPPEWRDPPERFEQYRLRMLANDSRSFAALTRAFAEVDLAGDWSSIACPTLIIGCTRDEIKPAAECAQAAQLPRHGRYAQLDSSHFAGIQTPHSFATLVLKFLEKDVA